MSEMVTQRRKKILIADDSEMNRDLLAAILEDEYDIVQANDGVKAVDYLQKHAEELSLVLLDLVMPQMDGFEVLAYMNKESLKLTLETGYTWFWSRSRQELWNKGATSGNLQKVIDIHADCDDDTLLVRVKPAGPACHTGSYTCFFKEIYKNDEV